MSGYYNKDELKEQLELENIYDLIVTLGGEPEYTSFGLISQTICHNLPNEGSYKLYYYENTKLFKCYTDCDDTFDIFELIIKAVKLQKNYEWELYDAMCFVAEYFGFSESERPDSKEILEDWLYIQKYQKKENPGFKISKRTLKEYDSSILTKFTYPKIQCWIDEGISDKVCKRNLIGYYPGKEQITIPHFDIDNRLIGIRGRALINSEAEAFGKYKPLYINRQLYNHPLSINLYNLNNSKENIKKTKTAILFESEKSALLYQTFYGYRNDISVACCGSSVSNYQIDLLLYSGAKEIIVAFDRQFQEIGDKEFQRLKNKILNIYAKYHNIVKISAIFDKELLTAYKASPIDEGKKKFEYLLENRIRDFSQKKTIYL